MRNGRTIDDPRALESVVGRIAALLRDGAILTSGDVSELRRMDPRRPAAAFFKIEGAVLADHLPPNPEELADRETRWGAIITGLAHLGVLHQPGARLGRALADAGYSDLRFVRLVRGDADRLVDELPSLARFLAAKAVSVDWTGAARLILTADGPGEERVRRSIARDFYGALARLEASAT